MKTANHTRDSARRGAHLQPRTPPRYGARRAKPIARKDLGDDMAGQVLVFVVLSLMAFLASTQQSSFLLRMPIWIAGVGFLGLAVLLALPLEGHDAVFAAVRDAWSTKDDPTEGVLFRAFSKNAGSVQRYITPLLDLLIVFGAMLGALAFLALTPGEFLERAFVRPLALGLIGATAGAAAALCIVAVSLGGPVKQSQFVGLGDPAKVYDGDTFWLGDVSVRLLDVDAPELRQTCRTGDAPPVDCGRFAREALGAFIAGKIVSCVAKENRKGVRVESYSRPLVQCEVIDGTLRTDLGEWLVRSGYAAAYAYDDGGGGRYAALEANAAAQRVGLLGQCSLHPKVWRSDSGARQRFVRTGAVPAGAGMTIGDCSRQPKA